jgi:hypothetical protein
VGHLPGPYTIPNVYADVYCVFTNRTPATAMRGFGITGVDFAIENHMDKVAIAVDMDPIELRILNAYRDGDMKAHRRLAKNTALIECCQVAAEKATWAIGPAARQASSLRDGGGARAEMPAHTALDQKGTVTGYAAGSYARGKQKSGPASSPQGTPPPVPRHDQAPVTPRQEPAPRPQPQPAAFNPPPLPPPPAQTAGDARRTRFSSISGLRRR